MKATIGDKIKWLRNERKMTQKHLADALSVTPGTISNWETGRRLPSVEELQRLTHLFDTHLGFFDEQHDTDLTQTLDPRALNQLIDFKPLASPIPKYDALFYAMGGVLLFVSPLLSNLINVFSLFIGLALLGAWGVMRLVSWHAHHAQPHKRLIVPTVHEVLYIHPEKEPIILKQKATVEAVAIIGLFVSLAAQILVGFTLIGHGLAWLDWMIILLIITTFLLAVFRAFALSKTSLFKKKLHYQSVKHRFSYASFSYGLLADTLIFALLVFAVVSFNLTITPEVLVPLAVSASGLNVIVTYWLTYRFRHFTRAFTIMAKNQDGGMKPLV